MVCNCIQHVTYMLICWHSILCFSAARETIATNFNHSLITDGPNGGTTIVSAGGMFELGFFTPNGSSSNLRYVGIWYSKLEPKTVVWVANRDEPLSGTGSSFVIADDGNLNVLDEIGKLYWSSEVDFSSSSSSSVSKTAKLMNSGNLVLSESRSGKILWESFKNPTDTFLPGMKMDSDDDDEDLVLTSWKSLDDPAGGMFELGFFTPNGSSSNSRYLGIWYSKLEPKTVVWVANRYKPINGTGNSFVIADDGNLNVLDEMGEFYWSSNVKFARSSVSKTAKLMNSGNLVLSDIRSGMTLWESFKNPTDTFLPGMKMDSDDDAEALVLTSWKSLDDPAGGNFTFRTDEDGGAGQFAVFTSNSIPYWRSSKPGKFISSNRNEIPSEIADLLSNFNVTIPSRLDNSFKRLVMGFDGKLRYFNSLDWDSKTPLWNLSWFEPKDRCSVFNACGNFGSCNLNNGFLCKCLPGFESSSLDYWTPGDFSGGCSRKSQICDKNGKNDKFLSLKKMNVGNPDRQFKKTMIEDECRNECLIDCDCQAYAYEANSRRVGDISTPATCWIWNEVLNNLQEEYDGGRNFYARVALLDIEQTVRNCEPCGTNMIPYPLSTGPNCGDPMYFSFYCNTTTGQVSFQTPSGIYRVTNINPKTRTFVVPAKYADNCEASNSAGKILQLNQLAPFHVNNWCKNLTSAMASDSRDELVVISWDPPLEPTCASSADCNDWPDSTCNAAQDGKKRCLCILNFRWNNSALNCTRDSLVSEGGDTKQLGGNSGRKIPLSLIIAVTCSVFFCLCCIIAYVLYRRRRVSKRQVNVPALELYDGERNVEHLMQSGQFRDDEKKGIDVPFFDLETLLAATDNFSDANKLGQGGFGPVYKGKFSGGQEFAVKRLSSVSGQGLQEFKNEVLLIAKLQHRNLVRLMGYCISGEEKMLLYEYMPNKSLDSFIFDRSLCVLLDWEMRFNIILGIARGLLYLHQDSRLRIIHRDLKTSNILLDEEMNPKISDFGLARIFGGKQTEAATDRIIGTYGYMSPEYALEGLFSDKSDVFSFGVVVLEIISGKRNTGYRSEQALSLLGYAWRLWKEEKALDLMDQTLHEKCNSNELLKCVNVGLLCVQEDPSDRPTMSSVVLMLGSETATLPSPKQPAFVAWRALSITASSSSKPETSSYKASSSSKPETSSYNESSITSEDG